MSTKNTQTLMVRDFGGISRYLSSANQPPNKFYTAQNLYTPNKGEYAVLGGVTDITGSGFPGCTGIKSVSFLKTSIGYERFLVLYDHAAIPTPSAPTAVAVTGTAYTGTKSVTISYVGLGGESTVSAATSVACGGGASIQVTIPAFPTGIVGINIFVDEILNATFSSRLGLSNPSTVTLSKGCPDTSDWLVTGGQAYSTFLEARYIVESVIITFGTGGSLIPGQIYYYSFAPQTNSPSAQAVGFGLASVVTTNQGSPVLNAGHTPNDTIDNPAGQIFSFTIPLGYNSVTIKVVNNNAQVRQDVSKSYTWTNVTSGTDPNIYLFLGTTPDDMIMVGSNTNGFSEPWTHSEFASTGMTVKELPYQSNFGTYRSHSSSFGTGGFNLGDPFAFNQLRINHFRIKNVAAIYENDFGNVCAPEGSGLACIAMTGSSYSATTDYQIIPTRGTQLYSTKTLVQSSQYYTNSTNTVTPFIPVSTSQFFVNTGQGINFASYVNRMYFVNGQDYPFYTNGYVIKPMVRSERSPYIPITTNIAIFNDRIILAGGINSNFNTQNVVYYSAAGLKLATDTQLGEMVTFSDTLSITAGLSFISAIAGDSDIIQGLGVYSDSLTNQGTTGFLVIGKQKSVYTWTGTTGVGAQPIQARTGFASGKCFATTAYGPVFVGRENVYLMTPGGQATKIGNDVEAILKSIPNANLPYTNVIYHDSHVKIGYKDTTDVDREIWLNLRNDEGGVVPVFTGPHIMKSYQGQDAAVSFNSVREVRFSYSGNNLYKRDDSSSYLNDGSVIPIVIETNDMGLSADDFSKTITDFYIRAKINQAISISMTLLLYDSLSAGSGLDYVATNNQASISETMTLPWASGSTNYRLFQKVFASRYNGDILRFTMSFSVNTDFRTEAISWLFDKTRRRRV